MTHRPEPSVAMMVAGIGASESAATSDSGNFTDIAGLTDDVGFEGKADLGGKRT